MICRRMGLIVSVAAALWLAGCARPVEEVKASHAGQAAVNLEQAYADLLDTPVWTLVKQRETSPETGRPENVKYVKVSGNLAGTTAPFEAWYRVGGEKPVLAWFVFKGERKDVADFDRLLSTYFLTRELGRQ